MVALVDRRAVMQRRRRQCPRFRPRWGPPSRSDGRDRRSGGVGGERPPAGPPRAGRARRPAPRTVATTSCMYRPRPPPASRGGGRRTGEPASPRWWQPRRGASQPAAAAPPTPPSRAVTASGGRGRLRAAVRPHGPVQRTRQPRHVRGGPDALPPPPLPPRARHRVLCVGHPAVVAPPLPSPAVGGGWRSWGQWRRSTPPPPHALHSVGGRRTRAALPLPHPPTPPLPVARLSVLPAFPRSPLPAIVRPRQAAGTWRGGSGGRGTLGGPEGATACAVRVAAFRWPSPRPHRRPLRVAALTPPVATTPAPPCRMPAPPLVPTSPPSSRCAMPLPNSREQQQHTPLPARQRVRAATDARRPATSQKDVGGLGTVQVRPVTANNRCCHCGCSCSRRYFFAAAHHHARITVVHGHARREDATSSSHLSYSFLHATGHPRH